MAKTLSVPVSSPSKAGVQRSDVQSFARRLEQRFQAITGTFEVNAVERTDLTPRPQGQDTRKKPGQA
ncbi:MAG TPA: hypothetical protein VK195_13205 [Burkholderiaceae bacterium]|nr:hypothetical protein [Burkholderiaceae bacterium]